jgi:hypothetical protein
VSALVGFVTVAAVVAFAVVGLRYQIRAARREESVRDRIIRESLATSGRVGPHDPRLPAGIDAALDDYVALDPDLAELFGPAADDPLRDAIDEHRKENGS